MAGVAIGSVDVYGTNLTADARVYFDGASVQSISNGSGILEAELPIEMGFTAGVHQVSVHQSSGDSNTLTLTVYSPVQGPQPFNAIPGYFPGFTGTGDLAMADLNGDGYADVIMVGPMVNIGSSSVNCLAIVFGRPDGQLGPAVINPDIAVAGMSVGDVNGDGAPDIVTATVNSSNSTVISVLLNDGKGNFSQASSIPYSGNVADSFTLADIDGDGRPDFLLTIDYSIYFLKNLGGGSFAAPVSIAQTEAATRTLRVGDFNGDGKLDVAFVGPDQQIHLLLNQGGGSFSNVIPSGISGQAGYFAVGDFNGDGHLDIAVQPAPPYTTLTESVLLMYLGQGDGSFTAAPSTIFNYNTFQTYHLVTGDFDGDENLDIAGVNGDTEPGHVKILWGDGAGGFSVTQVNGPMGFSLAAGDINGDRLPDLIIPDRWGILSVVLGQKQRNILSATSFTPNTVSFVSAGDVNGDGLPDLFVSSYSPFYGLASLYLNQGNGKLVLAGTPSMQGILLADLNGNGLAELIGIQGANVVIWPGTGDPSFGAAPIQIGVPGLTVSQMQIADMDGDGRPDIVLPGVILYNEGNFKFTVVPVKSWPLSTSNPFVIADFNQDGRLDIVTSSSTLLGQSGRTFQSVSPNGLNLVNGTAAGDFNQDGYPDVIFEGIVYYGKGDGTFYEQSRLNVGPVQDQGVLNALAVRDFNGDGRPDILECLFFSEQCVLFTNDGSGGFQRSYFASGASSTGLIAVDFTGNGKLDLVLTNYLVDYRPANFDVIFHK